MSTLRCDGVGDCAAFSGDGSGKNNPAAVAVPDVGPLPPGRYYIVDRGSGGVFSHIKTWAYDIYNHTERGKWLALFRTGGEIDDRTIVDGVR